MSTPRLTADAVRRARAVAQRRGPWRLLKQLESREPDLAEWVLEDLTELHHAMLQSGLAIPRANALSRKVQLLLAWTAICLLNAPPPPPPTRPPRSGLN